MENTTINSLNNYVFGIAGGLFIASFMVGKSNEKNKLLLKTGWVAFFIALVILGILMYKEKSAREVNKVQ